VVAKIDPVLREEVSKARMIQPNSSLATKKLVPLLPFPFLRHCCDLLSNKLSAVKWQSESSSEGLVTSPEEFYHRLFARLKPVGRL